MKYGSDELVTCHGLCSCSYLQHQSTDGCHIIRPVISSLASASRLYSTRTCHFPPQHTSLLLFYQSEVSEVHCRKRSRPILGCSAEKGPSPHLPQTPNFPTPWRRARTRGARCLGLLISHYSTTEMLIPPNCPDTMGAWSGCSRARTRTMGLVHGA